VLDGLCPCPWRASSAPGRRGAEAWGESPSGGPFHPGGRRQGEDRTGARGKHGVGGMAQVVFGMLDEGWSEEEVARQLGMEADELVRLKYVTGFAKLFEDVQYRRAWETRRQIKIRREFKAKANGDATEAKED
jgi:hypothetical protein